MRLGRIYPKYNPSLAPGFLNSASGRKTTLQVVSITSPEAFSTSLNDQAHLRKTRSVFRSAGAPSSASLSAFSYNVHDFLR